MLLTRIEELVFAGGRASYRRVEITSIIRSCLLRSPDVPVELLGLSWRAGIQTNHDHISAHALYYNYIKTIINLCKEVQKIGDKSERFEQQCLL